ncbi:hypothetical protein DDQ41_27625 [Streptomyces spongiicola]|uniref:Uncharacterized protein n=1 Tax=Streptomyces spongiicola TaxID=1690221 RepID=A0ABM6VDL8_9ACTN|nr:hypothetical protein DDQ41_27625 [Streptomyces spongiicola]
MEAREGGPGHGPTAAGPCRPCGAARGDERDADGRDGCPALGEPGAVPGSPRAGPRRTGPHPRGRHRDPGAASTPRPPRPPRPPPPPPPPPPRPVHPVHDTSPTPVTGRARLPVAGEGHLRQAVVSAAQPAIRSIIAHP